MLMACSETYLGQRYVPMDTQLTVLVDDCKGPDAARIVQIRNS